MPLAGFEPRSHFVAVYFHAHSLGLTLLLRAIKNIKEMLCFLISFSAYLGKVNEKQ